MRVHVRLSEPFWRAVGQRELDLDLASGAQVGDLLSQLCQEHPALEREIAEAPLHVFIGDEEAFDNTPLAEDSRVHLVWAIAGG